MFPLCHHPLSKFFNEFCVEKVLRVCVRAEHDAPLFLKSVSFFFLASYVLVLLSVHFVISDWFSFACVSFFFSCHFLSLLNIFLAEIDKLTHMRKHNIMKRKKRQSFFFPLFNYENPCLLDERKNTKKRIQKMLSKRVLRGVVCLFFFLVFAPSIMIAAFRIKFRRDLLFLHHIFFFLDWVDVLCSNW